MKRERRAALKQFNERQNSRVGMRCFCEHRKGSGHVVTLRRQSSWHCLGFDLDPALGAGGLQKVHYVAAKLDLVGDLADTDTLPPDIEARLLVTKFANWAYERERRSFLDLSSLNQDDGDYFLPFGAQIRLTEVILGAQCPSATLWHIWGLAKAIDRDIAVSRARLGFKYFEVKPDGRYPPN
jgi:hypothetical protein